MTEQNTNASIAGLQTDGGLSIIESQERANIDMRGKWKRPKSIREKDCEQKPCSNCQLIKPAIEFTFNIYDQKYSSWCKECNNAERRAKYKLNPEKILSITRKSHYGLTPEIEAQILHNQKGACATCNRSFSIGVKLCRDHCHDFNYFRGFLCQECNLIEGWARKTGFPIRALTNMLKRFEINILFTGVK